MTDQEREALLHVIRHFKKPEMSDLDAALLCIKGQGEEIRRLQDIVLDFKYEISRLLEFSDRQDISFSLKERS